MPHVNSKEAFNPFKHLQRKTNLYENLYLKKRKRANFAKSTTAPH